MTRHHAPGAARRIACPIFAAALLLAASAPSAADDLGDEPPVHAAVLASLERFAVSWMEKLREHGTPNAPSGWIAFTEYSSPTTELKPTGHAKAPFVGLVRYTERLYRCADLERHGCVLQSATPVTEIFRYQDGRWIY